MVSATLVDFSRLKYFVDHAIQIYFRREETYSVQGRLFFQLGESGHDEPHLETASKKVFLIKRHFQVFAIANSKEEDAEIWAKTLRE